MPRRRDGLCRRLLSSTGGGLRVDANPGDKVHVHEPRVRHPRPDHRGRHRAVRGPLLSRAHLRAARHVRYQVSSGSSWTSRGLQRHTSSALLARRPWTTTRLLLSAAAASIRHRETWLATSPPCSVVVQTSMARCSSKQRSPPCSSPTTSPIVGYQAWDWRSSGPTSAATSRSSTTGYFPASTRRSS